MFDQQPKELNKLAKEIQQAQKEEVKYTQHLQELESRQAALFFNDVVESCFSKCITSFTTNEIEQKEKACLGRCSSKYFRFYQRGSKILN